MTDCQFISLDVSGHRLVALAGNQSKAGTPIVFIHGITASVHFWPLSVPETVREGRPWYSLSLPAHFPALAPENFAPSDITIELFAEILGDAIHQLVGNQPVLLIGHSTGAFSALILASLRSQQVSAVLCISGFAEGRWTGLFGFLQTLARRGDKEAWLFRTLLWFVALLPHHYFLATALLVANYQAFFQCSMLKATLKLMRLDAKQHNWEQIRWLFAAIADMDIQPLLSQIHIPVCILAGEKDPIIPMRQARLLESHIPKASLEILPGVGHMILAECSVAYQRLLTNWIRISTSSSVKS